jgi:hypothetical protein
MPGETTTNPTEEVAKSAEYLGGLIDKVKSSFSGIGGITGIFKNVIDQASSGLNALSDRFSNLKSLTDAETLAMSALSAETLGASQMFKGAGEGLNLFSNQIKDVIVGAKKAAQPIEALGNIASSLGLKIDLSKIKPGDTGAINEAAKAIENMALRLFGSADASLIAQDRIIQTTAAAGGLGKMFAEAGVNLQNINNVALETQKTLADTIAATHMTTSDGKIKVGEYYEALGKIPGAMRQTIDAASGTAGQVNMLTATIQLAKGSGREYTDIIKDMAGAYKTLGLSGDGAAKFTARMGEVSNKFNVELSAVRDSLTGTAGLFSKIGTENQAASTIMEGATRIVNNYMQALKDTGISGAVALSIIHDMTAKVTDLTTAQKAFLSSQSGGPGGLRGAFDIELKMKEGKINEVFEDVRKTMMKQFGKIVSVEEASKDEGAAQQLTRQRLMLQQGPLGQFAKTDQDAGRILEAFSKVTSGEKAPADLSSTIVQDTMKAGKDLQEKTATDINKMQANIEKIKVWSDSMNLGAIQKAFTIGIGTNQWVGVRSPVAEESKARLRDAAEGAGRRTAEFAKTEHALTSGSDPKISGKLLLDDMVDNIKNLKGVMGGAFDTVSRMVTSGKTEDAKQKVAEIENRIAAEKEAAKKETNTTTQYDMTQKIAKEERALDSVKAGISVKETQTHTEALQQAKKQSEAEKLPIPKLTPHGVAVTAAAAMPAAATVITSQPNVATTTAAATPVSTTTTATAATPTVPSSQTTDFYRGIIDRFESVKQSAPKEMQSHVAKLEEAVTKQDQKQILSEKETIQNLITRQEKTVASFSGTKQSDAMKVLNQYTTVQNELFGVRDKTSGDRTGGLVQLASKPPEPTSKQTTASTEDAAVKPTLYKHWFNEPAKSPNEEKSEEKPVATALRIPPIDRRASPAAAVESVAATNASAQSTAAAAKAEPTAVAAGKTAPEVLQVHVNIDGICPHCRNLIHGDRQADTQVLTESPKPFAVA